MKFYFLVVIFISTYLNASNIKLIDEKYANKMLGLTYHKECPVSLDELRIVNVKYLGFDNNIYLGDIIVHKDLAFEVFEIFKELFEISYAIKQIIPIEKYNGDDFASIEADNTSAFNCRKAEGSQKYSKHSYGKAIDLNPLENPYVYSNGTTSHEASQKYLIRKSNDDSIENKAVLTSSSKAVQIFKKYGWKWGGDWKNIKDYQHFQK
ncbi:D-alanyl-D-alanine carboxypeptidase, peptidase M15 family [Arcobacter venerupis]|uniref:D-alanyl-D-alanine carboxypeptidase, peptidase M15 family n=1 Tax=Arcobacter venerupis TaxID=1054033 RepID=A0AAE7BAK3_9BACT|nr:M15 family metallopeptidase [Arcobacter venerupis]QKF66829.1 D-alanyl-D-alanine carboxypeptidase, peptidase M15 family [Arcobacter venerupis]